MWHHHLHIQAELSCSVRQTQITTLTFFRFSEIKNKLWGFSQMQFAHSALSSLRGQSFYKLMGSGRGAGFNPFPDWSVYALLQVWEDEQFAQAAFQNAPIFKAYRQRAEVWTVYMKNIVAKGLWSGQNPFSPSTALDPENPRLAVITRATIKWHKLIPFWRYVPQSQGQLLDNPGLLFTKGIGEIPVIQMATFSMWKRKEDLHHFAYQSSPHIGAIQRTRSLQWYSEELFARFQPYRHEGMWEEIKLD
jgi:hypothetical protein